MKEKDMAKVIAKRKKLNKVLLIIQVIASVLALLTLAAADLLPARYFGAIAIILFLLLFMTFLLLVLSARQRNRAAYKKKRVAGVLMSLITSILCIVATVMMVKVIQTMNNVTDNTQQTKIGVYVLKDDSAKEILDAKDYTFAFSDSYDYYNTVRAIEVINEEVKQEVATKGYSTVPDMVDALYDEKVGAVILNEAYIDVLEDMEAYEEFSDKTRLLYEVVLEEEVNENAAGDITKEPFVVYISGSDTRDATLTRSRSDVNILAVVNPVAKQILLLNTPRDYYVDLIMPGEGGQPDENKGKDKLTHCGIYGMDCSIKTLENLYGIEVNYYTQINFTGVEQLVDAVGGITVESDRKFKTRKNSSIHGHVYRFKKGENELNGDQALAFARERKNLGDGDYGRGAHQMAVIKGLFKKIQSPTILTSWSSILDSMEGMFSTDIVQNEMSALVKMQLDDTAEWNIRTFNMIGENAFSTETFSMPNRRLYVMYQDEELVAQAKELVQKVVNGEILTDEDLEKKSSKQY